MVRASEAMESAATPKRLLTRYLLFIAKGSWSGPIASSNQGLLGKSNKLVTFSSFLFAPDFAPDIDERNEKRKRYRTMKAFFLITLFVSLAVGSIQGQTLLTETTWGGAGSDVADAVASGADGSSYVVGITDSFTTDQVGTPSPKIFVEIRTGRIAKLAKNLEWDDGPRARTT
jgi:hypothetical protein